MLLQKDQEELSIRDIKQLKKFFNEMRDLLDFLEKDQENDQNHIKENSQLHTVAQSHLLAASSTLKVGGKTQQYYFNLLECGRNIRQIWYDFSLTLSK